MRIGIWTDRPWSLCTRGIQKETINTGGQHKPKIEQQKSWDSKMMMSPHTLATLAAMLWSCNTCIAFQPPNLQYSKFSSPLALSSSRPSSTSRLHVSNGSPDPDAPKTIEEDAALQWDMFTRHHALDGEWWGTWSTYNYMGDLEDSTVAGLVACAIFIFAFVCTHLVVQVEEMHSS